MANFSVIAQNLNIYTPQDLTVSQGHVIVPLLDGQVLSLSAQGTRSAIVNLVEADWGVPFGMTAQAHDVIVTVSSHLSQHFLLRVKPDGQVDTIADLTQRSGFYGAPFGVAVYRDQYWVTLSTDVVEATSELVQVSRNGEIQSIANLTEFRNPFGLVVQDDAAIVAQSSGHLVRVSAKGAVKSIVDLKGAGLGLPFNVAVWRDQIVATTNTGLVVAVDRAGKVTTIADVAQAKYQIPSGIVAFEDDLMVTTNGGFLLRIAV